MIYPYKDAFQQAPCLEIFESLFLANSEDPDKTMYQSMFSLLLVVRSAILKFSSEVSTIAEDIEKKNITKDVEGIYKRYIKFVNSYYFREITAKDQGLEIYEQAIGILNIQRNITDLDDEIEKMPIKLTFKYFSINQGILSLPEGFNPDKVRIQLRYSWSKAVSYDQNFNWVEGV